ncbi:type II toxin-antitoxin system PemK/MazF family toxin [Bdellovibrionales bacterium]|nr:type II toxin-antitoxin system PemK/MazF family toxin [Bdellovibrionales bacterium]
MEYKKGDVFLARLSPIKGNEPGKDRPVIVIQNDILNKTGYPTCVVVPCSSVEMPETSIRPVIKEDCFNKKTFALLDQIRAVDVSKRFLKKIGQLSEANKALILNYIKENIL